MPRTIILVSIRLYLRVDFFLYMLYDNILWTGQLTKDFGLLMLLDIL